MKSLEDFREIWLVDFEFHAPPGHRPEPICMVAREYQSGKKQRLWQDELQSLKAAPFPTNRQTLLVAYYASAEIGCFLARGWPLPARVLDLYVEFRCLTNGRAKPGGDSLLGALMWYGLDTLSGVEKEDMRQLAMRGGPWTTQEKSALLDYCETDVDALAKLLPRMVPSLGFPRALIRGRYVKAAAHIEHNGIPIDKPLLQRFRDHWPTIVTALIDRVNADYGVYEGRTFRHKAFERWLSGRGIPWPRLASGRLDLKDDTFRQMGKVYPAIAPLRELRYTLSKLKLADIAIGPDSRNRCLLSVFRAKTGRNQPSNARFIFGPAVWLRCLIRPEPRRGLAYIDWAQQEIGIAAALSGDQALQTAYRTGDPYLALAIQAGAAPADATKKSHKYVREQFKQCFLAVHYGMAAKAFGVRIGQSTIRARELLRSHRETYREFWAWSDGCLDHAYLYGKLWTAFGWVLHTKNSNPRTIQNFLMQANGAEMLRLACSYAVEAEIKVCAPVHDAILIEAPLDQLDQVVAHTRGQMARASREVLAGFELSTDVQQFQWPERYHDERGTAMWEMVIAILHAIEG